jgi:hypothetical protein
MNKPKRIENSIWFVRSTTSPRITQTIPTYLFVKRCSSGTRPKKFKSIKRFPFLMRDRFIPSFILLTYLLLSQSPIPTSPLSYSIHSVQATCKQIIRHAVSLFMQISRTFAQKLQMHWLPYLSASLQAVQ